MSFKEYALKLMPEDEEEKIKLLRKYNFSDIIIKDIGQERWIAGVLLVSEDRSKYKLFCVSQDSKDPGKKVQVSRAFFYSSLEAIMIRSDEEGEAKRTGRVIGNK